MNPPSDPIRHRFPKSHHLRSPAQFARVYEARTAQRVGPLRIHALPNALGHHRLGLSIGTRVGNAVRRNRLKRLLRESFRLDQHALPGAYDLVIVAHPHDAMELADYRRLLAAAVDRLHRTWVKRADTNDHADGPAE